MSQTFTLFDAAEIFDDVYVSDLRNDIKRGVLRHVGTVPYASKRRTFDYYGIIEIGLSRLMRRQGIPMNRSVNVIHDILTEMKKKEHLKLPDDFGSRDPDNPVFVVFFPTPTDALPDNSGYVQSMAGMVNVAHGWDDIGDSIKRAYLRAGLNDPALYYGEPRFATEETIERATRDRPVFTFLNLTESLIAIDSAVDAWRAREGR